jgi:hypothetical protein
MKGPKKHELKKKLNWKRSPQGPKKMKQKQGPKKHENTYIILFLFLFYKFFFAIGSTKGIIREYKYFEKLNLMILWSASQM